ncbi:MAG: arginyl-tRNA synthetase, partial [Caproiciproducens sp.]|nr:arginyl-tRNA synthetase [Caproiciproducens sp.]
METIIKLLNQKVSEAFGQCGYPREFGLVSVSDRPDLCQFQCNGAFAAAKQLKKAPHIIANQVADILSKDTMFSGVTVAGAGFINLSADDKFLLSYVNQIVEDKYMGIPQAEIPEMIMLDYGGPNVAKPLHIGHLRSAVIGEALKRIVKSTGRTAIGDVHLGDWGLQIGLVISELWERHPDWACFSDEFDPAVHETPSLTADELNEIYPLASKKSKENAEFKQKAQSVTAMLQKGHAEYITLWKEITRVSIADMKINYENLNVSFDYWYGESDAEKYVPKLLEILKNKDLLFQSEGAMVVDVSEQTDTCTIPPVIIKKTDDSNIYATTDLATIIQRVEDFHPAQIWYVVDNRQSMHFTQVFRCAQKAGLDSDTKLEHLGFGTMNGTDGKPYKTRDGGVMPLSELCNIVFEAALDRVNASEFSSGQDKTETARKIALATIKFGDLINHRLKDYTFDLDKFLAKEGKTGSFLLYTIARINSILRRLKMDNCKPVLSDKISSDVERELLLKLALSNVAFINAFTERAPNYVCENAYQLSSVFSKFYHDNHILSEADSDKQSFWV